MSCMSGRHRMSGHKYYFHDAVTGEDVYKATCDCGVHWMVNSQKEYPSFSMRTTSQKDEGGNE